jgi:hypothetical protein
VFALAPNGCRCDAQLGAVSRDVRAHNLKFYLVDRSLPRLPEGLTDTSATRLVERDGVLAARYNAEKDGKRVAGGPVLVFVGSDGQVAEVLPKPTPTLVERELSTLAPSAAPAS